ncbi:hypothetical protein BKI52_13155 [marine bacterium AO1-C]|nr:hypothetical protein BKI52_13155 [marine bacterium AO1-C]
MKCIVFFFMLFLSFTGKSQRCGPISFNIVFLDTEKKIIYPDVFINHQIAIYGKKTPPSTNKEFKVVSKQNKNYPYQISTIPQLSIQEEEYYVRVLYQNQEMHLNFILRLRAFDLQDTIQFNAGKFVYLHKSWERKKSNLIRCNNQLPYNLTIFNPPKILSKSEEKALTKKLGQGNPSKEINGIVFIKKIPLAEVYCDTEKVRYIRYVNPQYIRILRKYLD